MKRLRITLRNVRALQAMNRPPVARRANAPTVCNPGARLSWNFDKHSVYFVRNSMAPTYLFRYDRMQNVSCRARRAVLSS